MTTTSTKPVVDEATVQRFLEGERLVVVGASPQRGNFGATIASELGAHGHDVVVVHPDARPVFAFPAYPTVADVPGEIDGVVVAVPAAAAADVVRQCAARGVRRVWLFRGLGSAGSLSDEAVAAAEEAGMELVPGACPLMFLEPVGWFHRAHRSVRRRLGALRLVDADADAA